MPRTRFEDDPRDDDFPARPARSGNGGLLVVLLVAGALLVVVVCGGGLAFLFMARTAVREQDVAVAERQEAIAEANQAEIRAQAPKAAAAKGTARAPMARAAFEAAVRGKKQDEVVAAVGRPDETREQVPEPGGVLQPGGRDKGEKAADRFDWWVFRDRVKNEATGKPYASVRVRFGPDGKADRIEYP
jgi:hypothetical protein